MLSLLYRSFVSLIGRLIDSGRTFVQARKDKVIVKAEIERMERRVIIMSAKDFEWFEKLLNAPPRELPKLRELMARRSPFEEE